MSEMAGNVRQGLNQDARFLVVQYSKSVAATKEEVQTVAFRSISKAPLPFAFRGGSLTFVAPGEPTTSCLPHGSLSAACDRDPEPTQPPYLYMHLTDATGCPRAQTLFTYYYTDADATSAASRDGFALHDRPRHGAVRRWHQRRCAAVGH